MSRYALSLFGLVIFTTHAPAQPRTELKPGEELNSNEKLTTADGRCVLTMQGDGNLVWMWHNKVLWHSGTGGLTDAKLAMQTDGNLVIYGRRGGVYGPKWATDTADARGAKLVCDIEGNLVVEQGGLRVWSSNTQAGPPRSTLCSGEDLPADARLCTPDGRCVLTMQGDGNLVWTWNDKVLWDSGTARLKLKDPKLAMQADGNLVIYGRAPDGTYGPQWATDTASAPGAKLVCDIDGNLAIYKHAELVWSSGTLALEPATFKLRVTRPDSIASGAYSIDVHVNGKLAGNIKNNETKTFDVTNGRIGRNELTAFAHVTKLQHFPNSLIRDTVDKYAGSKFFGVSQVGEEVSAKVGYLFNVSGDTVFEVTDEVGRTWVAPYVSKVVFHKQLLDVCVKTTEPVVLGNGSSMEKYSEKVTTTRFEFTDRQKVEAFLKATATTGVKTVEAGVRAEWEKTAKSMSESVVKEAQRAVAVGDGKTKKRFVSIDHYRTGVSTVYIEGKKYEIPFKFLDHNSIHAEDVK